MTGYIYNFDRNELSIYRNKEVDLWVAGLATFSDDGTIFMGTISETLTNHSSSAVVRSLAGTWRITSNDIIAIELGFNSSAYWFDISELEVNERVDVKDGYRFIHGDWGVNRNPGANGRETLLRNRTTGEQRALDGRFNCSSQITEDTYLARQKIKAVNRGVKSNTVGLYDISANDWRYRVEVSGGICHIHPNYFIELQIDRTIVRDVESGAIHGYMSGVNVFQQSSYDEEYLYVLDKPIGTVFRYEISTKIETQLNYLPVFDAKYSATLSASELLVHGIDENTLKCYDLRSMSSVFDIALPFDNIVNDFNRQIDFHRVGSKISFVRTEVGEFSKSRARYEVRYFFDPDAIETSDFQIEPIHVRHEPVAIKSTRLHDYRMYYDGHPCFSMVYRQMLGYCVSICNEYGYSIWQDGDPYDELWSGLLIVDLQSLQLSRDEKKKLQQLMKYIRIRLEVEINAGPNADTPVHFKMLLQNS